MMDLPSNFSDGVAVRDYAPHKPSPQASLDRYLITIGKLFHEAGFGDQSKGPVKLKQLPENYVMVEKARDGGGRHIDKYMTGHPSGRMFDSAIKFFAHLKWLSGDKAAPCGCVLCNAPAPKNTTGGVRRKAQKLPTGPIYRAISWRPNDQSYRPANLLPLQEFITKEHMLSKISDQPLQSDRRQQQLIDSESRCPDAYKPRFGEVVLSYIGTDEQYEDGNLSYSWIAGIVREVPVYMPSDDGIAAEEPMFIIQQCGTHDTGIYREVEVPLKYIRPLSMASEVLYPADPENWHDSIQTAMSYGSVISCEGVQVLHLDEKKPTIYMSHIYIGAEKVIEGDAVRLIIKRGEDSTVDDAEETFIAVMIVKGIVADMDVRNTSVSASLVGPVFHADKPGPNEDPDSLPVHPKLLAHLDVPPAMIGMHTWYPLSYNDIYSASTDTFAGRLYGHEDTTAALGGHYTLDYGRHAHTQRLTADQAFLPQIEIDDAKRNIRLGVRGARLHEDRARALGVENFGGKMVGWGPQRALLNKQLPRLQREAASSELGSAMEGMEVVSPGAASDTGGVEFEGFLPMDTED